MADGSWPMPVIRSASFCTGIGGWEVATEPLGGFEHLFFSEIEPFPSAVLAHHWPTVSNFGDLTQMDCTWWRGRLDAVWGSCPCQAFSFAGRRKGMKDKRGALTLAFLDRVDEIDPTYVLYENVKGILSDKSNAFGCLLGALAGEDGPLIPPGGKWSHAGYVLGPKRTIAWRLFDAQHGGVPQRRERVFVVGSTRDGADPRDILFEREGLRRDTPPRRGSGAQVADPLTGGARESGGYSTDDHPLIPVAFGGNNTAGPIDIATALSAHGGPHGRLDFETETFLVQAVAENDRGELRLSDVTGAIAQKGGKPGQGYQAVVYSIASDNGAPSEALAVGVSRAIQSRQPRTGAQGSDVVVEATAFSMMPQNSGRDFKAREVAVLQPLMAGGPVTGNQGGDVIVEALSVALRGRDEGSQIELGDEVANSLRNGSAGGGSRALALIIEWADEIKARVRRLTPLECERLQGLPDNHTRIPWRRRHVLLCPDGPRYKTIGNGLAIPDVRWIAMRLQRFHALKLRELGRAA